eukprot:GHRR01026279.1.p1 GENE.GHRR01026279.1~~GHRR01026279.1.p1  ORF type:complete len:285 (+),score=108.08 GHRR01026279.1:633-1487(+)
MSQHLSREKDKAGLLEDRRRLLEYVLDTYKAQGCKLQLPIGMNAAEPWLLDAVDVTALMSALHHSSTSGSTIDLLLCCKQGSRTATHDASRRVSSVDDNGMSAGGACDADYAEVPSLQLPQLDTGLSESEIKDLAYLVFAANCQGGTDEELLSTVRHQLDVDEGRATEVAQLLLVVNDTLGKMNEATGRLPVSEGWTATLELPVCLLGVVLPKDFKRFRSFVVWRDTLSHVLLATLAQSVRDGWLTPFEGNPSSAKQLMARLKAALLSGVTRCHMCCLPLWLKV